jgi:hypothetical protein
VQAQSEPRTLVKPISAKFKALCIFACGQPDDVQNLVECWASGFRSNPCDVEHVGDDALEALPHSPFAAPSIDGDSNRKKRWPAVSRS